MKKIATCLFLATTMAYCGAAQTGTPSCSDISLGVNGALNGFIPSPTDAWHQDVTNAPIDPLSVGITTTDSNGMNGIHLHPDFGTIYGIPYNVVDSSATPTVPVNFVTYAGDSDTNYWPLTTGRDSMAIEGGPYVGGTIAFPFDPNSNVGGDQHLIVLDRNLCVGYEAWRAGQNEAGWTAANGAVWDLTKAEQRPYGLTSADAAGLSIFSGLIRYDEIVAGHIDHAIRFTMKWTKNDGNGGYFTAPASHAAGNNWGNNNVIGLRIRLKADFDISGYSQTNQIILTAMKKYGMILADNGGTLYFQGTADPRWNNDDLSNMKGIPSTAFDVVKMNPVYDVNSAPSGSAPKINSFKASSTHIALGDSVTLTPTVTNASYSYIDQVGFVRGAVTVSPTATTTYTLTSRNAFGSSTATVTVTVDTAPPPPTVQSLSIAPVSRTYNAYTFTATAQLSNNTTQDVTHGAAWASSEPSVATIANGTLLFHRSGRVTVTAQDGSATSQPVTVMAVLPLRAKAK